MTGSFFHTENINPSNPRCCREKQFHTETNSLSYWKHFHSDLTQSCKQFATILAGHKQRHHQAKLLTHRHTGTSKQYRVGELISCLHPGHPGGGGDKLGFTEVREEQRQAGRVVAELPRRVAEPWVSAPGYTGMTLTGMRHFWNM